MTEAALTVCTFGGDDPRLQRCLAVRRVVFIEEQAVPEPDDVDGRDPACVHFLAQSADTDLGTARMRLLEGPPRVAKAERVAVHAAARGQGVGRRLMDALEAAAWQAGAVEVRLGAQLTAVPFYLRLGYVAYGPEFDDAGIPHRMMRRAAPAP